MSGTRVVVVGIAGPAASGKTLLARALLSRLNHHAVTIISADSYYKDNPHLSLEERAKLNYDHPSSIDGALLVQHMQALIAGHAIDMPTYDYVDHSRRGCVRIAPCRVIIIEGILILAIKMVRQLMNIKIYVDAPLDVCLTRRIKRDLAERGRNIEEVLTWYHLNVRPMLLKYIEPSRKYAHIVVPRGGKNKVALDMIAARVNEFLREGV